MKMKTDSVAVDSTEKSINIHKDKIKILRHNEARVNQITLDRGNQQ